MTNNSTPHLPEDYDAQVRRTIPYYDSIHLETINLVRALDEAPKVWLDTGCGTGALAERALASLPGTEFVLADPSEAMLAVARERLKGRPRVRFLRPLRTQDLTGEVGAVPDVITAVQCHHYLSRQERTEATRVCHHLLPSGGAFITYENVRPFTEGGIAVGKRNWLNFQVGNGKAREEAEAHLERFDREYFPITVDEHLDLLRRTGFRTVEMLWYSYLQAGFSCIK